MRRSAPHESVTEYRLCKEFGWTPNQLASVSAKKVEEFLIIINEIDRQALDEVEKAKKTQS
jgi:hypothetical protein